jgi:hypothetical protein
VPALEGHDLERLEVLALRSGTMLVTLLWLIVLLRLAYLPSQDMRHSGLWLMVEERHSPDAFLEHENGIPLTFDSYMRVPEEKDATREKLIAYCEEMRRRISDWFDGPGRTLDWLARADVYYGEQTMHEFMERTVWHAGQHSRQLMWALEGLGIAPDQPLGPEVFAGLPMPERVCDDADPAKLNR